MNYENIIEQFIQDMEAVKAPMPKFYAALKDARARIDERIQMGEELGETE